MSFHKAWVLLAALLLGGCAAQSGTPNGPIPEAGPKMIDIYRGATAEDEEGKPRSQEAVEALCESMAGRDERRECERTARAQGLIIDELASLEADAPGAKPMRTAPAPLYENYTRTSQNEIEVLFPRLPNPDIGVFVYPHLATRNAVPIPGYATVIPLYEKVEYALPGESLVRVK